MKTEFNFREELRKLGETGQKVEAIFDECIKLLKEEIMEDAFNKSEGLALNQLIDKLIKKIKTKKPRK